MKSIHTRAPAAAATASVTTDTSSGPSSASRDKGSPTRSDPGASVAPMMGKPRADAPCMSARPMRPAAPAIAIAGESVILRLIIPFTPVKSAVIG